MMTIMIRENVNSVALGPPLLLIDKPKWAKRSVYDVK